FDDQYVALHQRHSPALQRIQKFVHERISGPYIARQGKRNDAQFLHRSLLIRSQWIITEIPLSREPLCAGLAGKFGQLRDIRGNYERVHSSHFADPGSHFDRIGFAAVFVVGNDLKAVSIRERQSQRVAAHNRNFRAPRPGTQHFEHVVKHGLREFRSRRLIERRSQSLLGLLQVLDGNEDHEWSGPAAAAFWPRTAVSTALARSALSSVVRITVFATCTSKPDFRSSSPASASRTSMLSMSRQ